MPHRTSLFAILTLVVLATGCHRPGGALMPYTGESYTYWSTETQPMTVQITDVRNNDTLFTMDIPPDKQLTIQFFTGDGDDPVYTPDLMRYQVFDLGKTTGKLRSAMSVPNGFSRRIDIFIRDGIEYAAAAPDLPLRTDQLIDRPAWWTPEGGEMPEDTRGMTIYDD